MSQIRVTDWQGKEIHKKKRGFLTKKEAQEWELDFKIQCRRAPENGIVRKRFRFPTGVVLQRGEVGTEILALLCPTFQKQTQIGIVFRALSVKIYRTFPLLAGLFNVD